MFIPKSIVHASAFSILHVCLQTQQLRQKGGIHFPTFLEEKNKAGHFHEKSTPPGY